MFVTIYNNSTLYREKYRFYVAFAPIIGKLTAHFRTFPRVVDFFNLSYDYFTEYLSFFLFLF